MVRPSATDGTRALAVTGKSSNASAAGRSRISFSESCASSFSTSFPGNGKQRWCEGRIAELERKVGQQTLEIDFLKGCLQRIEEQRMLQALTGSPQSTGRSKKK